MNRNRSKLVLVVEDDWHQATALGVRLRAGGYDVLMAPGPSAGTVIARSCTPDLIITDLHMPAMHGLAFVRQLQETGLAGVPFIVITASHLDELRKSAMNQGATAYFEKPYDPAGLLLAVASALKPASLPESP